MMNALLKVVGSLQAGSNQKQVHLSQSREPVLNEYGTCFTSRVIDMTSLKRLPFGRTYNSRAITSSPCLLNRTASFSWDRFLGPSGAVTSRYPFCDHSLHSYVYASQFKRSCAPHHVRSATQLHHKASAID